ncbi:MAG: SCO family protein, partial [Bacteroidota bacterium]
MKYILDELQNGRIAYRVAAAARALRGTKSPNVQYISFLFQALRNIRYHDDSMDLNEFKPSWPLQRPSSAKREILLTFQWLRGYAKGALPELTQFLTNTYDFDPETRELIQETINIIEADDRKLDLSCCEIEAEKSGFSYNWLRRVRNVERIGNIEVENENGEIKTLANIIDSKPTVVAFFYTRCMNPKKCTLTINKMGQLQQKLQDSNLLDKVNLLAFTYDPSFDTPAKMRVFGKNRGVKFGPNIHMLRTRSEDFKVLSDFFQLGVNHVSSTVNQHRLELYVLNQNGYISYSYTRLQWDVEKVLGDVTRMVKSGSGSSWISSVVSSLQQAGVPLLLAFFPKCPICWAVYLSAFGISSLQSIPYSPWLIPVLMVAMFINLFILFKKSKVRNGLIPFWISLAGAFLVLGPGYLLSNQATSIAGVILIFLGACLNSLSFKHWTKSVHFISSLGKVSTVFTGSKNY